MNLNVFRQRMGTLLLVLGLAGCGGGDEGGSGNDNTVPLPPSLATQVQVVDGFSVAKPNQLTRLDLSSFVRGHNATLINLASDQPECHSGAVSGLTAEVDIKEAILCKYRFSARSGSSQKVATLNVLATHAPLPVLEPLSGEMMLSETSRTFDVVTLYGSSLPAGYGLKASSVVVQGGNQQGTATQSGNSITYNPPSTPDWNRLQFILEKPGQPDEDILGSLYVTVSESLNQAPTISETKYNYNSPANANPAIVTFQNVTVDLANLNNLSIRDPENNEWQLIEVLSYSASVQSAAPNDVTNKTFTFQAGAVGEHIVSYIVGDHEGGYRMGLMSFTVGPKEQPKTWSDIDVFSSGLKVYASPLYSELKAAVGPQLGAFVEPVWDTSGTGNTGNTLGAAGNLAAAAYCTGKRLPYKADLDALRAATGVSATERVKYPTGRPYLISDVAGTVFQTYSLTTGVVTTYVPGVTANPYVMCVSELAPEMSYTPTPDTPFAGMTNTVISDGAWHTIGSVFSTGGTTAESPTLFGVPTDAGPVGLMADNFRLSPGSCVGGTCELQAQGGGSQFGRATAQIANGVMTNKTLTVPVTFLQDAKVTAVTVTTDNKAANGTDANVVTLTLRNNAGNLVFNGARVVLDYTVSGTVTSPVISPMAGEVTTVGPNGDVVLTIKSSEAGTVTLSGINNRHGIPGSALADTTVTFMPKPIDGFIKPPSGVAIYGPNAEAYCNQLALGARLPTVAELQDLFINSTSATAVGQFNTEMCSVHGWPLSGHCGGYDSSYWASEVDSNGRYFVNMTNGLAYNVSIIPDRMVTCIR